MMTKRAALLVSVVLLLSCSRGPDPQRIGVFADTNGGIIELAVYGSESTSDSIMDGLTEGFAFPQGHALPIATSVKTIYINLPEAHIEEAKVFFLPNLDVRWHPQGHSDRDPQPIATQLSKSEA